VDLELTGKRVVVTGAGRGIGLAVTRGFVAEGAHVVAGSRAMSPELEELANAGSVTPVEVDQHRVGQCAARRPDGDRLLGVEGGAGERARGVRVNTVDPGPVATDLWLADGGVAATISAAQGVDPAAVAAGAAAAMVTGRFTRPEEVADIVLLLASPRTANVTGADFTIDGGMITTV